MRQHQTRNPKRLLALMVLAVTVLILTTGFAATAPEIVGDWQGAINTGNGSLRVVLHVSQDDQGKLAGSIDSPDQGAMGIAISTITFKIPDLHFEIERIASSYDGKINNDHSEITGEWKQGGASVPLTFKRSNK